MIRGINIIYLKKKLIQNKMKITSTISKAKFIFGLGVSIWIVILAFITINHSLSCVKSDGCLRSYCKGPDLKEPYKAIIRKYCPQDSQKLNK